ncbi:M20 family metallopeptidase [bacterium]|nr:M20 family metallopeptidase [bacterium]
MALTLDRRYQSTFVDTLCDLIRIPSRSSESGGEEGALQQLVAARMTGSGARVRTFEAADCPGFFQHPLVHGPQRQYAGRPTVVGEIGPAGAPALLVLSHSDTVPVFEPGRWSGDPFIPRVQDGKVYGLGANDAQWGVAAMLAMLRAYGESGQPLTKRVLFASTMDEEHGVGNGLLLLHLAGVTAECGLYLDGAHLQIQHGNLGGSHFTLRPAPDLSPGPIDRQAGALEAACRQISRERESLFDHPLLRDNEMRTQSVGVLRYHDDGDPRLILRFYTVQQEAPAEIQHRLEAMIRGVLGADWDRYQISLNAPWFEPSLTDPALPISRWLQASFRDVFQREPALSTNVKQDVFILNNHAGIPTISFGPSHSRRPGGYHQPDEYLEIDTAWKAITAVHTAIGRWLEGA